MQQYEIKTNDNREAIKELLRVICVISEQSNVKDITAICHCLEKCIDNDTVMELLSTKMIAWFEEFAEPIINKSIPIDKLNKEVFLANFTILTPEQKKDAISSMFKKERYEMIQILKENNLL